MAPRLQTCLQKLSLGVFIRFLDELEIPVIDYDEVVSEAKHGSELIKAAKYLKIEKITDSRMVELLLGYLGKGEAEALTLSKEKNADFNLIDERPGLRTNTQYIKEVLQ